MDNRKMILFMVLVGLCFTTKDDTIDLGGAQITVYHLLILFLLMFIMNDLLTRKNEGFDIDLNG